MTSTTPTILVTGAKGFIGRCVGAYLAKDGQQVMTLDHHDVDLSKDRVELPQSIETIYHFAGQIWGDKSLEEDILDNVIAMADGCAADRIVYASSCSIYGQNAMDRKTDETVAPDPMSPYAEGKLAGEEKLKTSSQACTILRYFNPYGPGQFVKMAVPSMITKAKAGVGLEIFGDGQQVRDFIFIEDMAKASVMAAAAGGDFEIFNVGSGQETSINQLAEQIVALSGNRSEISHLPIPEERQNLEVSYRVADISKLLDRTGWTPEIPLADGLLRCVQEMG